MNGKQLGICAACAIAVFGACSLSDDPQLSHHPDASAGRGGQGGSGGQDASATAGSAGSIDAGGDATSDAAAQPGIQLALGGSHTCALLVAAGSVRCWGSNSAGQLGYGNTANVGDNETPASAGDVNVGGPVRQIAAGSAHTCAVLTDGRVRCWGSGERGQLGYGNTQNVGDNESIASAGDVPVGGPVAQIAAGGRHTCAILTDKRLRCWGHSDAGQLGYGNTDTIGDNETPTSAGNVDVGGSVEQVALAERHTCAVLSTGAVRCWGDSTYWRLGYGGHYSGDQYGLGTPAVRGDVNVGGAVQQVAASSGYTCALLTRGSVRCWGFAYARDIGYGRDTNVPEPASAGDVQMGGTAQAIAAGPGHTCALMSTGEVRCWGDNGSGQLGAFTATSDAAAPSFSVANVGGVVQRISAGGSHSCALLSAGTVRCWGDNSSGQLGYGHTRNIGDDEAPATAGHVPFL